jgi:hypothetical protein
MALIIVAPRVNDGPSGPDVDHAVPMGCHKTQFSNEAVARTAKAMEEVRKGDRRPRSPVGTASNLMLALVGLGFSDPTLTHLSQIDLR